MSRKKHSCFVDSIEKVTPLVWWLAHYHTVHSGEASHATYFQATFEEFPDIFVVSDPLIRAKFRKFLKSIDGAEARQVAELERMVGLESAPPPRERRPRLKRAPSSLKTELDRHRP